MDENTVSLSIEEIDKIISELNKDLVYFRQIEFLTLYSKLDKYRRALCILRNMVTNQNENKTDTNINSN